MRAIGHLRGEREAALFSDYLYVKGIENQMEREADGTFCVWIREEGHLEAARTLLERFQSNSGDPEYQKVAVQADAKLQQEAAEAQAVRDRVRGREKIWVSMSIGPVTIVLMVVCCIVFFLSDMGRNLQSIKGLLITELIPEGGAPMLPEVRSGEVWRLVTPIFIHFGIAHIVFNMMWLKDLGTAIERRVGSGFLLWFVILTGALSNFGQFYYADSVLFGGMSGVVYALFGYIWMRGRFDPECGMQMPRNVVVMMIAWLFLCMSGVLTILLQINVANTAHAVGVGVGGLWGFLAGKHWFGLRRRR